MIAWMVILAFLMVAFWVYAHAANHKGDGDLAGCLALLSTACFIAIGVLSAVLAWRYLP